SLHRFHSSVTASLKCKLMPGKKVCAARTSASEMRTYVEAYSETLVLDINEDSLHRFHSSVTASLKCKLMPGKKVCAARTSASEIRTYETSASEMRTYETSASEIRTYETSH
ncbi:MAG: hypothetical protein ABL921_27545, partial [Pirellula sp.]